MSTLHRRHVCRPFLSFPFLSRSPFLSYALFRVYLSLAMFARLLSLSLHKLVAASLFHSFFYLLLANCLSSFTLLRGFCSRSSFIALNSLAFTMRLCSVNALFLSLHLSLSLSDLLPLLLFFLFLARSLTPYSPSSSLHSVPFAALFLYLSFFSFCPPSFSSSYISLSLSLSLSFSVRVFLSS